MAQSHLRSKQRHVIARREGSNFPRWRACSEGTAITTQDPSESIIGKQKRSGCCWAARSCVTLSSISVPRSPKAANPKQVSPVCCNRKPESSPRLEKLTVRLPSVPHLYARQLLGSERRFLRAFTLTYNRQALKALVSLDRLPDSAIYHHYTAANMYLDKRDNMGFQIAPALIIFLVILGAGGLVICGFAIMRFYGGDEAEDTAYMNRSVEQDRYMREVRERAWGKLPRYYIRQQTGGNHLPHDGQSVKYVDVFCIMLDYGLTVYSASNTTYG